MDSTGVVKYRVIIVGAGMAGLSAADVLISAGIRDIVVLEARNRVGGRIHTVKEGDGLIELGANYIHGTTAENSVYTLAQKHGLVREGFLSTRLSDGAFYTQDGLEINKELSDRVWTVYTTISDEVYSPSTSKDKSSMTVEDYFSVRYEEERQQFRDDEQETAAAIFNCIKNGEQVYVGSDLPHVPVLDLENFTEIVGGDALVAKGLASVLKPLSSNLPDGCVRLNREVTKIRWKNDVKDRADVIVVCSNGETYTADVCLVTVPLGYLKQHAHRIFKPSLPVDKLLAIDKINAGCVDKLFLVYDKPFWKRGQLGSVKLAWRGEEGVVRDPYKEWYKRIFSFDEYPTHPNVLVGWISGFVEARQAELLPEADISQKCTEILRSFLGDKSIPEPSKIIRSQWGTDLYTLGSYVALTLPGSPEDFAKLAEPVADSRGEVRLLFAGEATDVAFNSTMHGARNSGIREAERIIKSLS
ncbi:spermine oxidase [Lingula anatina]|uniref:Spermine oxidase n=1 Tax=Lingula anatina TaxID=7574 RepID=A0A1S3JEN9_LINAN|nr:spermine oxidase [Lingula anatina]|eukprot:XP_013408880.1 spermine oxidase [Lingula anatina]